MKKIMSYFLLATMLISCNDALDIQVIYPFDLQVMPVIRRIKFGETAEIRCQIVREGYYAGTQFFIRYFQTDGDGELRLDDGRVLTPNDLFRLEKDAFRLYYTSYSKEQQVIDIYVEDTHKQIVQRTFVFQHEIERKEE